MKKVSIIFSFRNEEKNIPELVKKINQVFDSLSNWKYESIFVTNSRMFFSSFLKEKIIEIFFIYMLLLYSY